MTAGRAGPLRLKLNIGGGVSRRTEDAGARRESPRGTPRKTEQPVGGLVSAADAARRVTIRVAPASSTQASAAEPLQPLMSALAVPVQPANGPKKRGRKKILNPDGTFKYPPRNRPSDVLRRKTPGPPRAGPVLPPGAMAPGRVHPLAASAAVLTERAFIAALGDVLGPVVPRAHRPDAATPFVSWDDAAARLLPLWLVHSVPPREITPLGAPVRVSEYSVASATEAVLGELCSLRTRLHAQLDGERRKPVAAELQVLEQRLCLEEEKHLCARLKNEYTQRVAEYLRSRD